MKALILAVGDEVLSGRVVNTNASFLAGELEKLGIETIKHITIGDNEKMLRSEVAEFINSDIDILITTGGLGPTHDDFTKEVICDIFNKEMELKDVAYQTLVNYFGDYFAKSNMKQAYFPVDSIVLPNPIGTAHGCIFEGLGKKVILLVGPPFENTLMFNLGVKPYLESLFEEKLLIKEYTIMGAGESKIEDYLSDFFKEYSDIAINPYASMGKIRYQITTKASNEARFIECNKKFEELMDPYIVSCNNEPIEEVVFKKLKELGYTISFTESLTGGMLASTLINVSGSSEVIKESLVTYSNEAKIKYLKVKEETIDKYNVASMEVSREMADGLYELTNSDVCISTTGIAGPTGGVDGKPVGLTCYTIKVKDKYLTKEKVFKGDRNQIRLRATMYILYELYKILKEI